MDGINTSGHIIFIIFTEEKSIWQHFLFRNQIIGTHAYIEKLSVELYILILLSDIKCVSFEMMRLN